jgi:hypothetical protein
MTRNARKWTALIFLGVVVVVLVVAGFLDLGARIAELRVWIASLSSRRCPDRR